jgi:uncharacterized SAM-binding protein YcdF (DUF218 family)
VRRPIPRFPDAPPLGEEQVAALTRIVFLDEPAEPEACDLIFVFGGTHPALWRAAAEAYHRGLAPRLLLTGGVRPHGAREEAGESAEDMPEARSLAAKLIEAGVPETCLILEERSTNTLENALFAREVFDFDAVGSVLLVCKSYAAGRQYRTLRRHLPAGLRIMLHPFDTTSRDGRLITRHNWAEAAESRARVFGEYLRIVAYGERGDLEPLEEPVAGLQAEYG